MFKFILFAIVLSCFFIACSDSSKNSTAGTATDVTTGKVSGSLAFEGEIPDISYEILLISEIELDKASPSSQAKKSVLKHIASPISAQSESIDTLQISSSDGSFSFCVVEPGQYRIEVFEDEILVGQQEHFSIEAKGAIDFAIPIRSLRTQSFQITLADSAILDTINIVNGKVLLYRDTLSLRTVALEIDESISLSIHLRLDSNLQNVEALLMRKSDDSYHINTDPYGEFIQFEAIDLPNDPFHSSE